MLNFPVYHVRKCLKASLIHVQKICKGKCYGGPRKNPVQVVFKFSQVKHDGRESFLLCACVWCLEQAPFLSCTRCQTRNWFPGDRLVLGTLYTFDVLSSGACRCAPPACAACRQPATFPVRRFVFFISTVPNVRMWSFWWKNNFNEWWVLGAAFQALSCGMKTVEVWSFN